MPAVTAAPLLAAAITVPAISSEAFCRVIECIHPLLINGSGGKKPKHATERESSDSKHEG